MRRFLEIKGPVIAIIIGIALLTELWLNFFGDDFIFWLLIFETILLSCVLPIHVVKLKKVEFSNFLWLSYGLYVWFFASWLAAFVAYFHSNDVWLAIAIIMRLFLPLIGVLFIYLLFGWIVLSRKEKKGLTSPQALVHERRVYRNILALSLLWLVIVMLDII